MDFHIILLILGVLALIGWVIQGVEMVNEYRRNKQLKNMKPQETQSSLQQQQEVLHTKDLVIRTLRAIGCEPSVNEEDENRIDFQYQGGNFFIITADGYVFTYLYFIWWYDAPLDNIDALSAIQKAVNNANCADIGCNVMYTINQEENNIGVHSRCQMLFSPEISTLEEYLRAKLQELFKVRNNVVMAIKTELGEQ